jgi:YidC/Oxa1 family membrane protein insertase
MQTSGAPGPGDTRNLMIFLALMVVIMLAWNVFVTRPAEHAAAQRAAIAAAQAPAAAAPQAAAPAAPVLVARDEALASSASERVPIAAAEENGRQVGAVDGSILLAGARFDDLSLNGYRETIKPDSPEVTLLSPHAAEHGFDAFMGWQDRNPAFFGVGEKDVWTAPEGARLTPDTPLTLSFKSGDGLEVTRTIALDDNFMFTITDVVRNVGNSARDVRPFGVVRREGLPPGYRRQQVVHQGMVGVFGPDTTLQEVRYERAVKHAQNKAKGNAGEDARILELQGPGGWLGITDHYWLAAIAVDKSEAMSAFFDSGQADDHTNFRAAYTGAWRSIAPGESVTYSQRLFAGAKRVDLLRAYEHDLGLPRFDSAVDWGMFFFLTRPLFALVDFMGKFAGNFGVGILLSTVVIRTLTFPLTYQSFRMAAKMRAVAPKMKEIQERYAADKQRQQQEVMKLYQVEKVNPISGCLPMLLQVPVFWALYKTLTVTIEMRHTPFFGWIHDLSAKDPTSILNLFGLLPFDPSSVPVVGAMLAIGLWPIFYGFTMAGTQALSPPPTDPTQAQIFRYLPILFTFFFSGLASGLVIYYTWSNLLTTAQQYVIMRRQGVETQLDKLIVRLRDRWRERKKPAE